MQIKTTLRFHLTSKTTPPIWVGEGVGKKEPCTLLVRMQTGVTTLENNMEAS
jgi:hypothetical protein